MPHDNSTVTWYDPGYDFLVVVISKRKCSFDSADKKNFEVSHIVTENSIVEKAFEKIESA